MLWPLCLAACSTPSTTDWNVERDKLLALEPKAPNSRDGWTAAVRSRDPLLRLTGLRLLATTSMDSAALAAIEDTARHDPHPLVRDRAMLTLALGIPATEPRLAELTRDPRSVVRWTAASRFGATRTAATAPVIEAALADPCLWVQRSAIELWAQGMRQSKPSPPGEMLPGNVLHAEIRPAERLLQWIRTDPDLAVAAAGELSNFVTEADLPQIMELLATSLAAEVRQDLLDCIADLVNDSP